MKVVTEMEKNSAFKCGTFGTASDSDRKLATGNFDGHLQIWDMEKPADPIYDVQAHASIVNAMDGCGGTAKGHGPPEIATCGRDGCVRVWDPRQEAAPVALFQPSNKENVRCSSAPVSVLNSYRHPFPHLVFGLECSHWQAMANCLCLPSFLPLRAETAGQLHLEIPTMMKSAACFLDMTMGM